MDHATASDLLADHTDFVRAVARAIVRDAHLAEDVAQETFVAAMRRAPKRHDAKRSWLASIARHRAIDTLRARRAAFDRELQVGSRANRPTLQASLRRAEIGRQLAEALLALEARYRDVIVLRYYEDLPPRVIAKRLNVPVETVRTRHRRGLDHLRTEFERMHGNDRSRAMGALASLGWFARSASVVGRVGQWVASHASVGVVATLVVVPLIIVAVLSRPQDSGPRRITVDSAKDGTHIVNNDASETPTRLTTQGHVAIDSSVLKRRSSPLVRDHHVGRVLEGVVRSVDGVPLSGAHVRLLASSNDGPMGGTMPIPGRTDRHAGIRAEAKTNVAGEYSLPDVPAGHYSLAVTKRGFVGQRARIGIAPTQRILRPIDMALVPSHARRGVLRDAAGNPVEGARVSCRSLNVLPMGAESGETVVHETDEAGHFVFEQIRGATKVALFVVAPGFPPTSFQVNHNTEFVINRGVERVVRFIERDGGQPVVNADVYMTLMDTVLGRERTRTIYVQGKTNLRGELSFRCARSDVVSVTLNHAHRGTFAYAPMTPLGITSGGLTPISPLALTPERDAVTFSVAPSIELTGRVLTPKGSSTKNARVFFRDGPFQERVIAVDADGRFRTRFASSTTPIGTRLIWATSPGQRTSAINVDRIVEDRAKTSRHVDLQLGPALSLRGRLVDEQSTPISGATIEVRQIHGAVQMLGSAPGRGVSDDKGAFVIPDFMHKDAAVLLRVDHSDYPVLEESSFLSMADARSRVQTIVLRRGAPCVLHVVDHLGDPVPYCHVAWQPQELAASGHPNPPSGEQAVTASQLGTVTLSRLAPGKHTFSLTHERHGTTTVQAIVPTYSDGEEHHIHLRMKPGLRRSGVVMSRGEPVRGARVSVSRESSDITDIIALVMGREPLSGVVTGVDGVFDLPVVADDARLVVRHRGYYHETLNLRDVPGDVRIELRPLSDSDRERVAELERKRAALMKQLAPTRPKESVSFATMARVAAITRDVLKIYARK